MNRTRSLVESSLLTGLAVVLFLAARYIPVAGIALSLLCPAPLVILGLRHRPQMSILALLVATVIVALLAGPASAVSFSLGFGVLGVALGALASKLDKAVEIMLYGIVVSLGSKLILMVVLTKLTGINPFNPDMEELRSMMSQIFSFYGKSGIPSDSLKDMQRQLEMTMSLIPLMFPAMLTLASGIDCLLSYIVSRGILRRIGGVELPSLPPFGTWRFPKSLFWAFALSLVILLLERNMGNPLLSRVGLNLRLLVTLLFMVQGVALFWDYTDFRGIARGWRFTIIAFAVLVPLLSQIAVIAGLADIWMDFRKRYRR